MFEGLREINIAGGRQRIPTSENIHRRLAQAVERPGELDRVVTALIEAGYIFRVEIDRNTAGPVFALVAQDLDILQSIRDFTFKELEILHGYEFHSEKPAVQILRNSQGRTPEASSSYLRVFRLAQALAHRVETIAAHPEFFHPLHRADRLNAWITAQQSEGSMRAADSPAADAMKQMNLRGEWGRVVRKYGVQFVVRVHLRKNEFDLVTQLIREKRIETESDLRYIRDTARTIETRAGLDPALRGYLPSISELRKTAQIRMIQSLRKPSLPPHTPSAAQSSVASPGDPEDIDIYEGI